MKATNIMGLPSDSSRLLENLPQDFRGAVEYSFSLNLPYALRRLSVV